MYRSLFLRSWQTTTTTNNNNNNSNNNNNNNKTTKWGLQSKTCIQYFRPEQYRVLAIIALAAKTCTEYRFCSGGKYWIQRFSKSRGNSKGKFLQEAQVATHINGKLFFYELDEEYDKQSDMLTTRVKYERAEHLINWHQVKNWNQASNQRGPPKPTVHGLERKWNWAMKLRGWIMRKWN